jgi:hypothetical protein
MRAQGNHTDFTRTRRGGARIDYRALAHSYARTLAGPGLEYPNGRQDAYISARRRIVSGNRCSIRISKAA